MARQWSLYSHITGHSAYTYDKLSSNTKFHESANNAHFKASIDTFQLISKGFNTQSKIDTFMKNFIDDLSKFEKTYKRSKGRNKKTNKQIQRNVHVNFKNDCLIAYHNSSSEDYRSENYRVEPHLHIYTQPSVKLGIGYQFIRDAIANMSEKYDVVFHLAEETGQKKASNKRSDDMTWWTKKFNDIEFKKRIENGWFENLFREFQQNYFETGNIQYYLKGIKDIKYRCNRLSIEHGLNFNLFLTSEQKASIKTIYSGDKEAIIALLNKRDDKIARAYGESLFGFQNIVVEEIEKSIGWPMPRVKVSIEDISDLKIKRKVKKANSDINLEKYIKSLNYAYKQDLNECLKYAKNEKELALLMQNLGYKEWKWRAINNNSGSRDRIGFTYKRNGRKIEVSFEKLDMKMMNIRAALAKNSKNLNLEIPFELHSHLKNYVPPQRSLYTQKPFQEIFDLRTLLGVQGFYVKELDSKTAEIEIKNFNQVKNYYEINGMIFTAELVNQGLNNTDKFLSLLEIGQHLADFCHSNGKEDVYISADLNSEIKDGFIARIKEMDYDLSLWNKDHNYINGGSLVFSNSKGVHKKSALVSEFNSAAETNESSPKTYIQQELI